MNSYRDLEIFIESERLAIEVHNISLTFPKFELFEEGSQLRRSSKSIPANIVEGYGRKRYKADLIKHLVISHSECDETLFHLNMTHKTGSFKDEEKFVELTTAYVQLSKKLNKFIQGVERAF
jgi:four helix bundle protein